MIDYMTIHILSHDEKRNNKPVRFNMCTVMSICHPSIFNLIIKRYTESHIVKYVFSSNILLIIQTLKKNLIIYVSRACIYHVH